jgi:hypothetical protein
VVHLAAASLQDRQLWIETFNLAALGSQVGFGFTRYGFARYGLVVRG